MSLPLLSLLPRRLRLGLLVVLTIAALGASLFLFLRDTAFASPPPGFTPRRTIPQTDVDPYGANFFLEREVEAWKRERTVAMARAAGIGWARQEFVWEEIEPSPGTFNWGKYDDIVNLLTRNGIQVIARLDRPPAWARLNASGTGASGPPNDFETYGSFVEAFARHYRGQVYYLQIWNEPNLAREWNDAPIDPAAYVRLLKIAHARAKQVDPNIRILTAPLAITLGEAYVPGSNVFRNMNDLQFLEEMYAAGAKDYFDILSANAFGLGSPPEDPPNPGKLNFQRVVLERAVMEKAGDANKSVWINEYGWNAAPATMPDSRLIWGRVTEEQQAEYAVRGIEYARQNWPWAGVFSIWFFRQVGDISLENPEYYFRMVDVDFTPRRVYLRLSEAAEARQVVGPGEYEETNPALQLQGKWAPSFDARASGGQMAIGKSGAQARLRFFGDALQLLARPASRAATIAVNIDGAGSSSIQIAGGGGDDAPGRGPAELTVVARNLSPGEHTAQFTLQDDLAVDGFVVPALQPPQPPWVAVGSLGVVSVLSLLATIAELRRRP